MTFKGPFQPKLCYDSYQQHKVNKEATLTKSVYTDVFIYTHVIYKYIINFFLPYVFHLLLPY